MSAGDDDSAGEPKLEPGITPAEARETPSKNTAAEIEALVPEVKVEKAHTNTGQEVIYITADRAMLILNKMAKRLSAKRDWQTPLALFAGLCTSLVTSDFEAEPFGLDGDTVRGIVAFATVFAFGWLVRASYRAVRTTSETKTIEETLDALKRQGSA